MQKRRESQKQTERERGEGRRFRGIPEAEAVRARSKVEDERDRAREEKNKTGRAGGGRVQVRDPRVKDGGDFGNAGLYAANNQCVLVRAASRTVRAVGYTPR